MDARKVEGATGIADVEGAEQLCLRSFEKFEQRRVMDAPAGVCIYKANAGLVTKRFSHLTLACNNCRQRGATKRFTDDPTLQLSQVVRCYVRKRVTGMRMSYG